MQIQTITRGKYQANPYQRALIQFAAAHGLKLWTVKDRMKVVARYELFIAQLN